MKKTWMLAIALLMLVLPAAGMAQGLPDFLSAAGEGIAQGAEAVSQSMAQGSGRRTSSSDSLRQSTLPERSFCKRPIFPV